MATDKKEKKAPAKKAPSKSPALVAWERRCELQKKTESGKVSAKEKAEIDLICSQRGDCEPGNKPE